MAFKSVVLDNCTYVTGCSEVFTTFFKKVTKMWLLKQFKNVKQSFPDWP